MTAVPVAGAERSQPWVTFQARLLANETGKGLRLMWRRRAMVVTAVVLNALTYLGIGFFIGGGHLVEPLMMLTLPALLALTVAQTAAVQGSGGVAEEVNGGTMEQSQLGPASPQVQMLGRIAALAVEGLTAAALLGAGFVLVVGLDYDLHPAALVPALLTVGDALGYGMLLAALTVRVASIGAITHVFNMVIMVFGGMMVPISVFPDGMELFAQLVPTGLGVQVLNATLAGQTLSDVWSQGNLPWLLAHTVALLAAGLVTYMVNIRRARAGGGLGPR